MSKYKIHSVTHLAGMFQELTSAYFNPKRWYKVWWSFITKRVSYWTQHFETWLWIARSSCHDNSDPILPDGDSCLLDNTLANKLRRCGAQENDIRQICNTIGQLSQQYSRNLTKNALKHSSLKAISRALVELSHGRKKIKLSYARVSVEVNDDSYRKLEYLHQATGASRSHFLRDAFTLLARYSSGRLVSSRTSIAVS